MLQRRARYLPAGCCWQGSTIEARVLYPPYPNEPSSQWIIVFSSYIDESKANLAEHLAQVLGISLDTKVWSIPEPINAAPQWAPWSPSAAISGTVPVDADAGQSKDTVSSRPCDHFPVHGNLSFSLCSKASRNPRMQVSPRKFCRNFCCAVLYVITEADDRGGSNQHPAP